MTKQDRVHQFVMGLDNDAFSNVQSQIPALNPLPPLEKIFNMVQQEENHKRVMSERDHKHENASAFAVTHYNKGGKYDGDPVSCKHCGKVGHEETNYFELVGYRADWNARGRCSSRGRGRGARWRR